MSEDVTNNIMYIRDETDTDDCTMQYEVLDEVLEETSDVVSISMNKINNLWILSSNDTMRHRVSSYLCCSLV